MNYTKLLTETERVWAGSLGTDTSLRTGSSREMGWVADPLGTGSGREMGWVADLLGTSSDPACKRKNLKKRKNL